MPEKPPGGYRKLSIMCLEPIERLLDGLLTHYGWSGFIFEPFRARRFGTNEYNTYGGNDIRNGRG
jgi:hypothetical protein